MVKTLEIKPSEFLDLRKLKENQRRYNFVDNRDYNRVYMCDCDDFGGGESPCDCNR